MSNHYHYIQEVLVGHYKLTQEARLQKLDNEIFLYGDVVLDKRKPLDIELDQFDSAADEYNILELELEIETSNRPLYKHKRGFAESEGANPFAQVNYSFTYNVVASHEGREVAVVNIGKFKNNLGDVVDPSDIQFYAHDVLRHISHQFGLVVERLSKKSVQLYVKSPQMYDPTIGEDGRHFEEIGEQVDEKTLSKLVDKELRDNGIDFIATLTSKREYEQAVFQRETV